MQIDEICIRKSPSLWIWIAVSTLIGIVVGFAVGTREQATLEWLWKDVPDAYCPLPIYTDGLTTYQTFFEGTDHTVCDKGSGKTSIAEGMNTKWRQRQSGLVRRSCGVSARMEDDVIERYMILAEKHNRERIDRWNKKVSNLS